MGEPATVRTTCPYCGVGCGVLATPQANGTVRIAGDPEHPANFGRLCSKGSALGETLSLEDRLLFPEIDGQRVGWDRALDHVARGFSKTIAEHGPDSVAFYGSGQLLTEDYYVANKLMKGFIGSANIDTNSRLCMASSVAGHKRAFGSDTVPGCYEDLELADLVVLVGSNLAWCHPVLFQRISAAKQARPNMRVVLIDPRRTPTAELADLHLPIASDGDVALFNGLLAELVEWDAVDRGYITRHTNGFAEALEAASELTLKGVAERTGCNESALVQFFDWFASTERTVTVYSQGVNQSTSGTDKVNAIINCHLATGRIGKPGMGPFSVTGQPNAMGGREVGGLANILAAHLDFDDEAAHGRLKRFWKAPRLADRPGLKAVELFKAIEDGTVKAVWIMATNPVDSLPEADRIKAALAKCPLVVVSDMSSRTDTLEFAHVRLPAAGWGEKDGTVTNSERRISRQRSFLPLPRSARPDWWIITQVARRMGFGEGFRYESAAEIFAEHAALSGYENDGSRDFDISGKVGQTAADYASMAPFQWPHRESSQSRMFADGEFFTSDRRAKFVPVSPHNPQARFDGLFRLNTGRVRDHWHTMTRTGKSARLSAHMAEPFAELHPSDARELGIGDAELVQLTNQYGSVVLRALITDRQQRGHVFAPMHWTDQFSSSGRINALVQAIVDPHSGQPALKMSEISVRPYAASWYGFAISQDRPDLTNVSYWALASGDGGYRVELAGDTPEDDWEALAHNLLGRRANLQAISSADPARGRYNLAAFDEDRLVYALFIAPTPISVARQWAAGRLQQQPHPSARSSILAGRPGTDQPDQGALVCSCFNVGVNAIISAVSTGGCTSVEKVGTALRAGTNCGSCRSEIQGLISAHTPRVAAE